jgi:hypothetical protein
MHLTDNTKNYCTLPTLKVSSLSSSISTKFLKKSKLFSQNSSEKLIKTLKFKKTLNLKSQKLQNQLIPVIFNEPRPNKYLKPIDLSSIDSEDDSFLSKNFEDPFTHSKKPILQDPFHVHQTSKKPLLKPITPTIKFSCLKLKS